ncbi:MAG: hypothetical protein ABSC29_04425 [Minisyncoccia bacterium]|jgi:hypothetical protein
MKQVLQLCFILAATAPLVVFAVVASSNNFTVDTDVIDVGGVHATSTNFNLNTSIGQPGTGISSSTSFVVKGGFLYFPGTSTRPSAPSDLTVSLVSPDQVSLVWTDNSNNEDGFSLERKTGDSGTYAEIVRTGSDITAYVDNAVTGGETYFYRVRAFMGDVYSAYSNEASTTVPSVPPPGPPGGGVSVGAGSGRWIELIPSLGNKPRQCSLDFNNDGRVDIADLSIMLYYYGDQNPPEGWCFDPSGNGVVDFPDISILMYYWT